MKNMASEKKDEPKEEKPVSVLEKLSILSKLGFELNATKKRIATAGIAYAFLLFTFIPSMLMLFSVLMTNSWLGEIKREISVEARHELKFNSQVFKPIEKNEKKISEENDNESINLIKSKFEIIAEAEAKAKAESKDKDKAIGKKFYKPKNDFEARVYKQLDIIKQRMRFHLKVLLMFYRIYFVSTYMMMILSILSGISLLFISKEGWANSGKSHQLLLTFFLVSSSAGIIYGSGPTVFEHENNIKYNKELFLRHAELRQDILSYASTGLTHKKDHGEKPGESYSKREKAIMNKVVDLKIFIHHMDMRMNSIHRMPVDFNPAASADESKIFNDLNKSMGGS